MFSLRSVCLSVCLSVGLQLKKLWTKFLGGVGHGPGTNEFNFGDDPDHRPDPGVRSGFRNPHSLDYRKSYQRILMKFYGELECGLETNWLHFGDDPHNYQDPGVRSVSQSVSGKNCHIVNTHKTDALNAAPISSILVTIRITVRIQESEVRNPDSLDYRLCWRLAEVCVFWALLIRAVFAFYYGHASAMLMGTGHNEMMLMFYLIFCNKR